MRIQFFLVVLLLSNLAQARTLECEIPRINGKTPERSAMAVIDPDLMLIEIWKGAGPETVLSENDVYVIDAPAISYDRQSDCKYSNSTRMGEVIHHVFECGPDVKTTIAIDWDQLHAKGTYASETKVPDVPSADFAYQFEFQDCHAN